MKPSANKRVDGENQNADLINYSNLNVPKKTMAPIWN